MPDFMTEAERRKRRAAMAATILLLACAIAIVVTPRSIEWLTGIRPTPRLSSPDDLPSLSSADATPFFRDRDQKSSSRGR